MMSLWRAALLTIIVIPLLALFVVTLPFAWIHDQCVRILEGD